MLYRILFTLLIASTFSYAQKTQGIQKEAQPIDLGKAEVKFVNIPVSTNSAIAVAEVLKTKVTKLRDCELTLTSKKDSKVGTHYIFQQTYNNTNIFRGQINTMVDKNNIIRNIAHYTFSLELIQEGSFPDESKAQFVLMLLSNSNYQPFYTNIYFYNGNVLIPALHTRVVVGDRHFEFIVDETGQELYYNDLNTYHHKPANPDSTVTVQVFNPDPLTTSGNTYGGTYIDNGDADASSLNNERVQLQVKADFTAGVFSLSNSHVLITEFSGPNVQPVTSTTPSFSYTRTESGFEDVNTYYHLTTYQEHMQSLGFNLVNYQLEVDVHALSGSDNSMFSTGSGSGRLFFGEGGVDDAEDADVIIHEYGHAISESAAPNTNNGIERRTLDEANGDYLATSYSRNINPFNWQNMFNWDGHNEFWPGREVTSTKDYQTLSFSFIYDHTDIWASCLMEIWAQIGRDKTDEVLLQSLYGYTSNLTMIDAAKLYLQADTMLNNNANAFIMRTEFARRNILSAPISIDEETNIEGISIINSIGFSKGLEAILALKSYEGASATLYNSNGVMVSNYSINGSKTIISSQELGSGIYILAIQTKDGLFTKKLIRF